MSSSQVYQEKGDMGIMDNKLEKLARLYCCHEQATYGASPSSMEAEVCGNSAHGDA